jgi:murein DD-endopeptidase MepM/ murein hydrolase activator NlpD
MGGPGPIQEAVLAPPAMAYRPVERPLPTALPPGGARHIVVRPGQSVGGLARDYHVTKHAIIAANHLQPPYKVEIGQHLAIPGAGAAPALHEAALHEPGGHEAVLRDAAPGPEARDKPAARPIREAHRGPEIIPLDQPAPSRPASHPAKPAEPHEAAGTLRPPAEHDADAEIAGAPPGPKLPHGGRMPWPVSGHVLASYGSEPGGGRNDGINIAAPKGAPVRAVEAGVVAYAGNELRGYGNLVLIKHPDGLISAYAHCEELLVKKGQQVKPGQVIAKVGATGGVDRPQLHFELRRGERAVDPRQFLAAPAPRAGRTAPAEEG